MTWLKYMFLTGILFTLSATAFYFYSQQNANVIAVQEVRAALKSAVTGELRNNQNNLSISKEDFISNLVLEVVQTQKMHNKKIKIDYVFLDDKDRITEQEGEITNVQFRVQLLNEDNKVQSETEQRISLKGGM